MTGIYMQSFFELQLEDVCMVNGAHYLVEEDIAYIRREIIDVPFQETNLSAFESASKSGLSVRVTVE